MFLIIGRHIFSEGKNTANTEHGSLWSFRGGGKREVLGEVVREDVNTSYL